MLDPVSESYFDVAIGYQSHGTTAEIESYSLEGDNVAREELVDRFGEQAVIDAELDMFDKFQ